MRIAINISGFLLKDEGWKDMVERLFQQLAKNNPAHGFVFIGVPLNQLGASLNVKSVALPFATGYGLGFRLWYDFKLPSLLKKEKIDVLINTEAVCSFRCTIPQLLLIKDLDFLQITFSKKNNGFIKRRFQKSLAKTNRIIAFNPTTKAGLLEKKLLGEDKIVEANFFANPLFKPMEWQEKETKKDKFSEGKEFFLYEINSENPLDLLILLKAFSLFKKRQQSNIQLLIVGGSGKTTKKITAKIATYKYRTEVKLLDVLPKNEMADLQAAAYCLFHFSTKLIDLPLLQAMQAGVPTIILRDDTIESMENVALYAYVNNAESIAEQMKIIYKDENLRSRIISAGLKIAENNTVEMAEEKVWSVISKL